MMETTKEWDDDSGQVLTATYPEARGTQDVVLTSPTNEGLDRTMQLTVAATNIALEESLTVTQTGKRELFMASDGEFNIVDKHHQFGVLKDEF